MKVGVGNLVRCGLGSGNALMTSNPTNEETNSKFVHVP